MPRKIIVRVHRIIRALAVATLFTIAALLLPALWGVGNLVLHVRAQAGVPAPRAIPEGATTTPPDRARPTAVVVTGAGGAEMSDFLIPYEALATTGAFEMTVVAPERRVIPLANAGFRDGGVDLVPHYSLDEYDRAVGTTPALIVIPFLPAFAAGHERALVPWIRKHADAGALVVSICAGSEVLAATGLVDGARATTHPSFFARLERAYPGVTWVHDVRYVESARAISSGAIASGMDATLAAIRRLLGRAEAERVARVMGYRHLRFLDDPAYPTAQAWGAFLGAAVSPWLDELDVLVHDGVSEVALGSVFDTYPTTLSTRLRAVSTGAHVIRTRHGMILVPRGTLGDRHADGLLVPGATVPAEMTVAALTWDAGRGNTSFVHGGRPGFAYDGALADLAARRGRIAAEAVATNLNYPLAHLKLEGPALPAHVVVVPFGLAALGVIALAGLRRRARAVAARRRASAR